MSGLVHRCMSRSLVACLRLHTAGAPPTIPWGVLAVRWHSTTTTAATAFRNRRAGADGNGAKLRARLRSSVRFTVAVDTAAQNIVKK
jgi:hypothetical protein